MTSDSLRRHRLLVGGAGALFFLSGASALVYQVSWQRILALHSGVGIYSVAMIVAAFMAGLGLGSHVGGVLSTRVSPRGALRVFALLELGIAAFGAFSSAFYYDWLYLAAGALYATPWSTGLAHFLSLLLPTGLMGMSLPFLVRATVRDTPSAGATVGFLYGINTLGASVGAALAPWVLIRSLGLTGAIGVAAAFNFVVSLWALALGALLGPPDAEADADRGVAPTAAEPSPGGSAPHGVEAAGDAPGIWPFGAWVALYALSGFCALSLEIVWFRIVDVAVKSTAFTFGTVLALYLLGSAMGSLFGAPRVARLRQPLRAFLACQCLLLIYSGAMIVLLARAPVDGPLYGWLFEYWGGYDGFKLGQSFAAGELLRLYALLPVALYGPPTLLMGLSFPILQRAVQDDPRTSGRKVGVLQAANIAGCVAGSLVVGLLALGSLGTAGTMRVLIGSGLVFAGLGLRRYGRTPGQLALLGGLVVTLLALPGGDQVWARLHGRAAPPLYVEEDATGVVAIMPEKEGRWFLSVNGVGQSRIPFAGSHTLLGSIPALVHPAPRDVAIVGLGSGNTAWAAALRNETESVTVYEISSPQPRLLERFTAAEISPRLRRFLRDPRIKVEIADGRNALERSDRLYDLIEADALRPDSAFSGNLYSVEFFERVARKLKPGGIMCTWAPTERVRRTFQAAFPHVLSAAWGTVLIGSSEPLPLDPEAWGQRLADPRVRAYLGGAEVADMVLAQLQRAVLLPKDGSARDLNHDLFPRDEFGRP